MALLMKAGIGSCLHSSMEVTMNEKRESWSIRRNLERAEKIVALYETSTSGADCIEALMMLQATVHFLSKNIQTALNTYNEVD